MQFQIISEGKAEIPESSRIEFLEKVSANIFALSVARGKISVLLN